MRRWPGFDCKATQRLAIGGWPIRWLRICLANWIALVGAQRTRGESFLAKANGFATARPAKRPTAAGDSPARRLASERRPVGGSKCRSTSRSRAELRQHRLSSSSSPPRPRPPVDSLGFSLGPPFQLFSSRSAIVLGRNSAALSISRVWSWRILGMCRSADDGTTH